MANRISLTSYTDSVTRLVNLVVANFSCHRSIERYKLTGRHIVGESSMYGNSYRGHPGSTIPDIRKVTLILDRLNIVDVVAEMQLTGDPDLIRSCAVFPGR